MSYDLMVFSEEAAPKMKPEFMVWYDTQTKWAEGHGYDDPAITTPELRSWLMEIEQTFPDMNGPNATDDHMSAYETDYCIGHVMIYAAFSWSLTGEAHETALRLAQKHRVGFYDPSFMSPVILLENNGMAPMKEAEKQNRGLKKPWWKLWQ